MWQANIQIVCWSSFFADPLTLSRNTEDFHCLEIDSGHFSTVCVFVNSLCSYLFSTLNLLSTFEVLVRKKKNLIVETNTHKTFFPFKSNCNIYLKRKWCPQKEEKLKKMISWSVLVTWSVSVQLILFLQLFSRFDPF